MLSQLESVAAGFLIASPALRDPNFDHAVVLMCMHGSDGAMGLVVNRPAPLSIEQLLKQIGIEGPVDTTQSVLIGGPVAIESGVLLYQADPATDPRDDEIVVTDELRLTPNQDMLRAIAAGQGPTRYQLVLGHSGWAPGQLEQEIAEGSWIPADLDLDLIFDMPIEDRWEGALLNEGLPPSALGSFRPQS